MPQTEIWFYQEADGSVPVRDWLDGLYRRDRRAYQKCLASIDRLRALGHELRRPAADYLREGIYELRICIGHVNYRLLYFFHGQNRVVLVHGLMKEQKVPPSDIDRSIQRKNQFERNPPKHTAEE